MESLDLGRKIFLSLWLAILIVSITQFFTSISYSRKIINEQFFQLPGYFTFSTVNAILGVLASIFGLSIRIENSVFMNYVSKKPNLVILCGIFASVLALLNLINFVTTMIAGMEKFKTQFLNLIQNNMKKVDNYQGKYGCCSWDNVHQFQQNMVQNLPDSCCDNLFNGICEVENVKKGCQYVNRDYVLNLAMISVSGAGLYLTQILVSAWYYKNLK